MTHRCAPLAGSAIGAIGALALATAAQAAPSNDELAAMVRQLQAQVQSLQARLDAQERLQVRGQAAAEVAQATAVATQAQLESAQSKIAASEAKLAALPPPPAYTVAWDGAPRISGSGNSFKIRGRLLLDATRQNLDRPGTLNDVAVAQVRGRQAFIGVEGNIGPNWFYKLEGGAVNGGAVAWDDAYIEYRHDARNSVIIGNQKFVGLENLTSTRFTSFMDRGPMDSLIDATYHLGVYYWHVGSNYSVNAGVTGHTLNNPDVVTGPGSSGQHERLTASARATVAPINDDHTTVHLGAWTRYRKRGDDGAFTYTAGYNSPLRVASPVTTGGVGDHDLSLGLEGAWLHDSLSLQGEFASTAVDRGAAAPNFDLRAGYAFLSWFPTGEKRNYALRGEFGRTRVLHPLSGEGWGALELLARYDFADFTAADSPAGVRLPNAGVYNAVTLGANWYPIGYVRFMANYTRGKYDNVGVLNDTDVDLFQLRGQIDW